jgi:hypothetical protein
MKQNKTDMSITMAVTSKYRVQSTQPSNRHYCQDIQVTMTLSDQQYNMTAVYGA